MSVCLVVLYLCKVLRQRIKPLHLPRGGYFMISCTAVLVSSDSQSQTLTKTTVVEPDGNTVVPLKYTVALYEYHSVHYQQGTIDKNTIVLSSWYCSKIMVIS